MLPIFFTTNPIEKFLIKLKTTPYSEKDLSNNNISNGTIGDL